MSQKPRQNTKDLAHLVRMAELCCLFVHADAGKVEYDMESIQTLMRKCDPDALYRLVSMPGIDRHDMLRFVCHVVAVASYITTQAINRGISPMRVNRGELKSVPFSAEILDAIPSAQFLNSLCAVSARSAIGALNKAKMRERVSDPSVNMDKIDEVCRKLLGMDD